MAKGEKKVRVNITMDEGVLERLDAQCDRMGMSRSAYITYVVASSLDSSNQLLSGLTETMAGIFAKEGLVKQG